VIILRHLERCWTSTSTITTMSDRTVDFSFTLRTARSIQ
jgi:hypothetical protein